MKPLALLALTCLATSALATTTPKHITHKKLAVAAAGNCVPFANTMQPFMLIIPPGQEIINAITECAIDANLKSASISGIGTLQDPTLGFFNDKKNSYQSRQFKGSFELTSLLGNISLDHDKLATHAHVTISTKHYRLRGGNLMRATAGTTSEVTFIPMPNPKTT